MHHPRTESGQAAAEYVGVLTVVMIVLALAGTVATAAGLPGAVVRTVKLGLCMVGGDVCRPADAAAMGLEPCVTAAEAHTRSTAMSILFVKVGGDQAWSVEERSDGTFLVTASDGQTFGGTAGIGLHLGSAFHVGADGTITAGFNHGRAWVLPDRAAVNGLFAAVKSRFDLGKKIPNLLGLLPKATEQYSEGHGGADATVGLVFGNGEHETSPLQEQISAEAVLGRRSGPEGHTWYLRVDGAIAGALSDAVPQLGRGHRELVAEITDGPAGTLVLRAGASGSGGDRLTETTVTLPLSDAGNRATALALFAGRGATGGNAALAKRLGERATVQTLTYDLDTDRDQWNYTINALGAEHGTTATTRHLVAAEVTRNGATGQRLDCLDTT